VRGGVTVRRSGNPMTGESAHGPGSTHGRHVSTNERHRNHDLSRAHAALPLEHQHGIRTVNAPRVLWLAARSPGRYTAAPTVSTSRRAP
jgi:hypothetical protein